MDVSRQTVQVPAALLAGLALSACFNPFPDAPRSCTTDADCFAGERCALAVDFGQCVDEDAPAAQAPRIDAARFEPAVTNGASALVLLTVNEAVDDGRVELLFDVEGVGQARASTSTSTAPAVQLDVSALGDGSVGLVGVSVVDVDGTPGDSTVANAVLRIDRTAPALAIAAAPINGTRFSDGSGLVVTVDADEDLTAITARQGEVNGNCLREGLRQARCLFAAEQVRAGDNVVVVEGVDVAGNVGGGSAAFFADAAPPRVVAPAVVVIEDSAGRGTAALFDGATVSVTLAFDEPLIAAPVLSLVRGQVVVQTATGRAVGAGATVEFVDVDVDEGATYQLRLDSAIDELLHEATGVAVPLSPPYDAGIPVGVAGSPRCASPSPAQPCVDVDGDGFVARSAGCVAAAFDINDDDARAAPVFAEVPGDGVDNDGSDGDAPRDNSTTVFVDDTAPPGGDGTEERPFGASAAEVQQAAALARTTGKALALRGEVDCNSFDVDDRVIVAPVIVGDRPGTAPRGCFLEAAAIADVSGWSVAEATLASNVEGSTLVVGEGAVAFDVDVSEAIVDGGVVTRSSARIVHARDALLTHMEIEDLRGSGGIELVMSVVRVRVLIANTDFQATHSLFTSLVEPVISDDQRSRIRLVGCVLAPGDVASIAAVSNTVVLADATVFAPGFPARCDTEGACVNDVASFGVGNTVAAVDFDRLFALAGAAGAADNIVADPFALGAPPQAIVDRGSETCLTLPADAGPDQR